MTFLDLLCQLAVHHAGWVPVDQAAHLAERCGLIKSVAVRDDGRVFIVDHSAPGRAAWKTFVSGGGGFPALDLEKLPFPESQKTDTAVYALGRAIRANRQLGKALEEARLHLSLFGEFTPVNGE